jgi:signal transduction histidine kinase
VPLFDLEGNVYGICGISTDITDRKMAEQQLREIKEKLELALRAGKMGIWEWFAGSNQVNWFGSHANLYGIRDEDFGGTLEDVQRIVHPGDRNQGLAIFEKTLREGTVFENTYRVIWPDESIHWLYSYGSLVKHENGKPWKVVGVTLDITADKLLKDKLLSQNKELGEINLTKDKLFSIVSHDLVNPLNSLLGFAQLMDIKIRNLGEADLKSYNDLVLESAHAMADMIKTLSEWSKSQRGKIMVHPRMVSPAVIVNDAFRLAWASAQAKKIRMMNNVPAGQLVCADEEMLYTIVRNIVCNAIKFSHPESTITCEGAVDHRCFLLKICDEGVGIEPDRLEKIFSVSDAKSKPGTAGERGTGLGLLVCKEFVELNNGKIWAESELGKGSVFYVELPTTPETTGDC